MLDRRPDVNYEIAGTESDSLNSTAAGWSLNTDRHAGNGVSLSRTTHGAVPLIEIHGDAVVQATDATLSALSIDDGHDKLVTNLSPQFDSAMTSYTSSASALRVGVGDPRASLSATSTMPCVRLPARSRRRTRGGHPRRMIG